MKHTLKKEDEMKKNASCKLHSFFDVWRENCPVSSTQQFSAHHSPPYTRSTIQITPAINFLQELAQFSRQYIS